MKMPDDLQAAIDAEPEARRMLEKLSAQNRSRSPSGPAT